MSNELKMKYDRKREHWYPMCSRGAEFTRILSPGTVDKAFMLKVCKALQIPDEFSNYQLTVTIKIDTCRVKWGDGSAQYGWCYRHKKKRQKEYDGLRKEMKNRIERIYGVTNLMENE